MERLKLSPLFSAKISEASPAAGLGFPDGHGSPSRLEGAWTSTRPCGGAAHSAQISPLESRGNLIQCLTDSAKIYPLARQYSPGALISPRQCAASRSLIAAFPRWLLISRGARACWMEATISQGSVCSSAQGCGEERAKLSHLSISRGTGRRSPVPYKVPAMRESHVLQHQLHLP